MRLAPAALLALAAAHALAAAPPAAAESLIVQSYGGQTTVVSDGRMIYQGRDLTPALSPDCATPADAAAAARWGLILPVCDASPAPKPAPQR